MNRDVNGASDSHAGHATGPTDGSRLFSILGRGLHVHGLPGLDRWLRTYWHFTEHELPPHPYTLRIGRVDVLPALRDASTHVAGVPGFELTWQHTGTTWQTQTGSTRTRLVLHDAHARISVADDAATDAADDTSHGTGATRGAAHGANPVMPGHGRAADTRAARTALYTALTEAVRASGLVPVHAAAIAHDGAATLLLGPSGTGKTTTLLRAVRAGWSPVAEDLVWLDPDTLRVYGWDRGVRLWPGTTQGLVHDATEADWDAAPDGKRFLPWERLTAQRTPNAVLSRVVLLERAEGKHTNGGSVAAVDALRALPTLPSPSTPLPLAAPLERLLPQHAVRVLWEAVGVPLADAARARLAGCIARLVREVDHVRLRLDGT